jgi:hypothetical protein
LPFILIYSKFIFPPQNTRPQRTVVFINYDINYCFIIYCSIKRAFYTTHVREQKM